MALDGDDRTVRGACALDCPDTCSWIVTVKHGQAVALRGDPDHPYTRGSLCNKVADYLAYTQSPGRLLYPLRRVGPKGSGEFRQISWDEALETNNPPVNVLFFYAANPLASAPAQSKVRRGLTRDNLFNVVVEHFLTDTARYADVVLPATMQIEHRDLLIAYGHLYLSWNEPAVRPPGECLPTTEMFRRLACKLGLDEPALYDSDETMARQVLRSGHPSVQGITLEALKARGSIRLSYPDPFVPFADAFPTPSGKLEFVSERMAQAGLEPVAGYTPSRETSQQDTPHAREYPLALIAPANHYFLNSIFANVPRQRQRAGAATVFMHPCDASPQDIRSGDEVRVSNERGSFLAIANVSNTVRRGVVASTKGRWPCDSKDGATINATVADDLADMGAGSLYHDNRVRVDKVP